MKVTIELSSEDIANGKMREWLARLSPVPSQSFCHEEIIEAQPVHDPERSVGMYADPGKDPSENDMVINLGEGIMKELVDLWKHNDKNRAEELTLVGSKIHAAKSLLVFIRHMGSLSHAIHHVRVRDGVPDEEWERSEEIALNMTNIASLTFQDLVPFYNKEFSWEYGDPNYIAYRRATNV